MPAFSPSIITVLLPVIPVLHKKQTRSFFSIVWGMFSPRYCFDNETQCLFCILSMSREWINTPSAPGCKPYRITVQEQQCKEEELRGKNGLLGSQNTHCGAKPGSASVPCYAPQGHWLLLKGERSVKLREFEGRENRRSQKQHSLSDCWNVLCGKPVELFCANIAFQQNIMFLLQNCL